ncbi:MAG: MBL fold metallo-hydrolase [Nanobdellota archaeon]
MSISLIPLGGCGEVGRNCLAVDIEGSIIILDFGFHLERFLELPRQQFSSQSSYISSLISYGALPDIRVLGKRKKDVVGIVCSHAHLDHIGALPFLSDWFSCPVHATPFTANVIRSLCEDKGFSVDIVTHNPSSHFSIGGYSIEFIPVAHSTPQTVVIAIHTPEGTIVYANDYKQDSAPPLGLPTDVARLKEISSSTSLLVLDSLYAPSQEHSPGEQKARQEVLSLKEKLRFSRAIVISTFSSHIHRLKSLCDLADSLDRTVVFMGRSLRRYILASKNAGLVDISSRGILLSYRRQVSSFLRSCDDPSKYVFVTTGHQGEPNAVLRRMADGMFSFTDNDTVVFSSNIIPVEISIKNRDVLERLLKRKGVSIVSDVHVSGHAFGHDHKELVSLLSPCKVIPFHGDSHMENSLCYLVNSSVSQSSCLRLTLGQTLNLDTL